MSWGPSSHVSCMRSLAGGTPQENRQPRQQVRHLLTQGRRPGRKRSGGAHDYPFASLERRDGGSQRPKALSFGNPPAKSQPSDQSLRLGRVNGYATLCAALSHCDSPPAPTNWPPRELRANRRPVTRR